MTIAPPELPAATPERLLSGVAHDGTVAGLAGAAGAGAWLMIADRVAGTPLGEPRAVGAAIDNVAGLRRFATASMVGPSSFAVLLVASFVALGLVAATYARLSRDEGNLLAAIALVFLMAQGGFYALFSAFGVVNASGALTGFQIFGANLAGCLVIGAVLGRRQPTSPPNNQTGSDSI